MHPQPLRKILAFNLLGGGVFLLFGVIARRGAAAGLGGDPVPQAMVITGLVVAFSATALAVALLLRLYDCFREATLSTETLMSSDGKGRLVPNHTHGRRLPPCSGGRPAGGRAWCWRWRWAAGTPSASSWWPDAGRARRRTRDRRRRLAHVTLRCTYFVGGWAAAARHGVSGGRAFRAIMLVTTAVVICAIGLFARGQASPSPRARGNACAAGVLDLADGVWAGAQCGLVSAATCSTLYVALELLTFAAVPLVSLDGRAETIAAALRYLLFALFGSVLYLLGAALFYGAYGTLDIVLLSGRVRAEPVVGWRLSLMTVGLMAKTALFPLHLWLPPAHAGAPAPASAFCRRWSSKRRSF